ncbi:ABC transporter substrate-binding protein, partial [Prevotella sp.]
IIANPWKAGTMLHRYILIPKGEEGDKTVAMLARRRCTGARCTTDTVRTPVESNLVFTAPHCQLLTELGCQNAITGVCDKDYINIPDIKSRAQADAKVAHPIMDCGSSMQPDIERIIALHPEALLISPFENSGGYGKLDKLRIPVIETADYMETSPLGRAEWIKLYGLLLGSSKADSLFSAIEKEYLQLKAEAAKLPLGLSILTERKTGNVWYVPGGKSTMGILLRDAHARYIFADDTHSGSLSMSPEQIIAKGNQVDVWAFKYFGGNALTKQDLLAEYQGYQALKAFQTGTVYETDTSCEPYFELTSFHPEILLREFIVLSHPEAGDKFGKLRFYKKY